jgi:hypothetical protein
MIIRTKKQLLKFYQEQGGKAFVILVHEVKDGYVILSTKPGCTATPVVASLIHTLVNLGIASIPTVIYIDFNKLREKEAQEKK